MQEQTFVEPVLSIIEALSKAARKAGDLSNRKRSVTLEVRYLGLEIIVEQKHGEKRYGYSYIIGWMELSKAPNPYDYIEIQIDKCVTSVRKAVQEKINASSK